MLIRSNTLTYPHICKIIEKLLDKKLLSYDNQANNVLITDDYDKVKEFAENKCNIAIKENREILAKNIYEDVFKIQAEKILKENGFDVEHDSTEFSLLCKELVKARITQHEVIKSRINGEEHPYELVLKQRKQSNTLKESMDGYRQRREKTLKARSLSKLPEKFSKILECFEYETGESDILLSEIDYQLTLKVAERLTKYPKYRNLRYLGKSLDEIYVQNNVEYSSHTTVDEEIQLLASIYGLALKQFCGLDRNHAEGLSPVVLGKSNVKPSEYRDVFRPDDIQEILAGLMKIKKKSFHLNPHLFLIPLIGLYQGMRVNEICQLHVDDITNIDGTWCIDNNENKFGKSLKNLNSKRINPIHPDLIKIGLISFCDSQKAKGFSHLWDGVRKISCDYYAKQGNFSHYFDKWFNGTFKKSLKLTNPEKQSFHSFRHTFIDWFSQNTIIAKHGQALTALSGHLDQDDIKAFGFDQESMAFIRYSKELNIKKQYDTLKLLKYEINIVELKIDK